MNILIYGIITLVLCIFSLGFIDPGLVSFLPSWPLPIVEPLRVIVYEKRAIATILFSAILFSYMAMYIVTFRQSVISKKSIVTVLVVIVSFLFLSYPALTHDLFNYITTAKVTYTYYENPYLVMPTEIPNEPNLAFTRAANKVALYGPVWILITAIPHFLGMGNIWQTIIAFKLINVCAYVLFIWLIYRVTKQWKNVIFFALNPLVLIEVLVSGHNDIFMMIPALAGLLLWQRSQVRYKVGAILLLFISCLTKGATLVLFPLFFIRNMSRERLLLIAYCLMSFVFFIFAPIREELYPWYAVWLISIASCMNMKKHAFLIPFTIVLSFALELRHLPYMYMGYYEGVGPILRTLVTIVPIAVYIAVFGVRKAINKHKT